MRRNKASGTDRENLGEVWLAKVLQPSMGELSPKVSSVYDGDKKRIHIASKYLSNVHTGTLDNYYASLNPKFKTELDELNRGNRKKLSNGNKHVQIVLGSGEPKEDEFKLYLDESSTLATSMADALAVSAIGGDHDVNPGNMIVTKDKYTSELNVGRIDFGHAANDLINAPEMVGGRVRDPANPIVDFFNRTTVAGARKGGDESKFWRDYEGFVPSKVLGEALVRQGSKTAELSQGLQEARDEFTALHDMIRQNPNDRKSEMHLINSLNAMHEAITGHKVDIHVGVEHNTFVQILNDLDTFILNNAANAVKAGKMMTLQAEFQEAIKHCDGDNFDAFNTEWIAKFHKAGLADERGNPLCPWFKPSKNEAPFEGSVTEYLISEKIKSIHSRLDNAPSLDILKTIHEAMKDFYHFVVQYFSNHPSENASDYINIIDAMHEEVQNRQHALENTSIVNNPNHESTSFDKIKARLHQLKNGTTKDKRSDNSTPTP
ncbi:MAG: hypothetical protein P1U39_01140 [Legionellaceae bacterium]|nr:hypothetical protein [Legionellaceae bacterium]